MKRNINDFAYIFTGTQPKRRSRRQRGMSPQPHEEPDSAPEGDPAEPAEVPDAPAGPAVAPHAPATPDVVPDTPPADHPVAPVGKPPLVPDYQEPSTSAGPSGKHSRYDIDI